MTTRTRIASFLVAALLAPAAALAQAWPEAVTVQDLGKLPGFTVRTGDGRVNGEQFPVAAIATGAKSTQDLVQALVERFKGKRTVTYQQGQFGELIYVSDVRSKQCPTCLMPAKDTLERIIKGTYAIMTFALPDGNSFAIGTPAGRLADTKPLARYSGALLASAGPLLHTVTEASFRFNGTVVNSVNAHAKADATTLERRVVADLRAAGYEPLPGTAATDGAALGGDSSPTVLKKGRSVVQYLVVSGQEPGSSLVNLTENVAP